jgi:hypothetical protein
MQKLVNDDFPNSNIVFVKANELPRFCPIEIEILGQKNILKRDFFSGEDFTYTKTLDDCGR